MSRVTRRSASKCHQQEETSACPICKKPFRKTFLSNDRFRETVILRHIMECSATAANKTAMEDTTTSSKQDCSWTEDDDDDDDDDDGEKAKVELRFPPYSSDQNDDEEDDPSDRDCDNSLASSFPAIESLRSGSSSSSWKFPMTNLDSRKRDWLKLEMTTTPKDKGKTLTAPQEECSNKTKKAKRRKNVVVPLPNDARDDPSFSHGGGEENNHDDNLSAQSDPEEEATATGKKGANSSSSSSTKRAKGGRKNLWSPSTYSSSPVTTVADDSNSSAATSTGANIPETDTSLLSSAILAAHSATTPAWDAVDTKALTDPLSSSSSSSSNNDNNQKEGEGEPTTEENGASMDGERVQPTRSSRAADTSNRRTKKVAKQRIQNHAKDSEPSRRIAPVSSAQSKERLQCPVCGKSFPRSCYFDEADYEKKVLSHMMTCSSSVGTKQVREPKRKPAKKSTGTTSRKPAATQQPPSKKKKATKRPTPPTAPPRANSPKPASSTTTSVSKEVRSDSNQTPAPPTDTKAPNPNSTAATKAVNAEESGGAKGSQENTTATKQRTVPQDIGAARRFAALPKVIGPGHILTQTWWRRGPGKQQRRKRTLPVVPFNLQHCVFTGEEKSPPAASLLLENSKPIEEEDEEPKKRTTRGSSRLQGRSELDSGLELRCPVCRRIFSESWLGSLTEDAMSRHVAKCTQKLFECGGGVASVKNRKNNLPKMFLETYAPSETEPESQSPMHMNRPQLSEEDREKRRAALDVRAQSVGFLLGGASRRALSNLFLKGDEE